MWGWKLLRSRLPPADPVNLSRQQVLSQQGRIPPPLALMFSMAEGSTKRLEGGQDLGWFVVDLDSIETTTIELDDPALELFQQQLAGPLANEQTEQLIRAMRDEMGVDRNDTAIEAVRRQLAGES